MMESKACMLTNPPMILGFETSFTLKFLVIYIYNYIWIFLICFLPFQRYPVIEQLEATGQRSVTYLFEPGFGNVISFMIGHFEKSPRTDPKLADLCRDISYDFCFRVEVYGKDLGLYIRALKPV